jgi:proline dehydrogenase
MKKKLTAEEQEEWDKVVVARFDLVCSEAHKNNVSLLLTMKRVGCKMQLTVVTDMMRKYKKSQLCSIHCNCIVGIVWII